MANWQVIVISKTHKNPFPNLQNQFSVCNTSLLHVRYLHEAPPPCPSPVGRGVICTNCIRMLSLVFRAGISEQPDILLPSLRGRGEGVGLFNLHHYESLGLHHLRHMQPPYKHRRRCRRHHTQPRIRGRMQRQPQRHMRPVHRQESYLREADAEGHHMRRQNDKLPRPACNGTGRNGLLNIFSSILPVFLH